MANCVVLIKIDSYKDKLLTGTLYDPCRNKFYPFRNVLQLIEEVNEILDSGGKMASRSEVFDSVRRGCSTSAEQSVNNAVTNKTKTLAVFRLNLCFRKYGTWQGVLKSVTSDRSGEFRNIVEMIMMIDMELESMDKAHESDSMSRGHNL